MMKKLVISTFLVLSIFSILMMACNKQDKMVSDSGETDLSEVLIATPAEIGNDQPFVITNVSIIPMTGEVVLDNQTVLIENGLIKEIGAVEDVAIPSNYEVIDAQHKGYLLPGLMDMHYHRRTTVELFLLAMNGVMVVREMWGSTGALNFSRLIIDEGLDFPQLFIASPGMNGSGGAFEQFTPPVDDPDSARALVRFYKDEGFHFVKAYNKLEPAVYDAIIDEAAIQGIPVVGHVPVKVGTERVFTSGQRSSEHFLGFGYFAVPQGSIYRGQVNMDKVNELVDISIENEVWLTPTVVVDVTSPESIEEIKQSEEYQYLSQNQRDFFENGFAHGSSAHQLALENKYKIIEAINERGGKILLGTDAGFGFIIPGFSIHDELEHYVSAGLTNYEALQTAITNPATFLEINQLTGSIEAGKRADMILLESNPLDDIGATRDRAGIVLRGKWLSQPHMLDLLTED